MIKKTLKKSEIYIKKTFKYEGQSEKIKRINKII
jgi:hypothetical protein